jgi:hypothetical protein
MLDNKVLLWWEYLVWRDIPSQDKLLGVHLVICVPTVVQGHHGVLFESCKFFRIAEICNAPSLEKGREGGC